MIIKDIGDIEAALMQQMLAIMQGVRVQCINIMLGETHGYYNGGSPSLYRRTGKLGSSPRATGVRVSGRSVAFTAYLYQGWSYSTGDHPSMSQVLNLANYGSPWTTKSGAMARATVGSRGFWERAVKQMEAALAAAFG